MSTEYCVVRFASCAMTMQTFVIMKATVTTNIGPVIERLQRERGFTASALAMTAEIDPSNVSRLKRGIQSWSSDTLARLARVLDVPISAIFLEAEQAEGMLREPPAVSYDAAHAAARRLQRQIQLGLESGELDEPTIKLLTQLVARLSGRSDTSA